MCACAVRMTCNVFGVGVEVSRFPSFFILQPSLLSTLVWNDPAYITLSLQPSRFCWTLGVYDLLMCFISLEFFHIDGFHFRCTFACHALSPGSYFVFRSSTTLLWAPASRGDRWGLVQSFELAWCEMGKADGRGESLARLVWCEWWWHPRVSFPFYEAWLRYLCFAPIIGLVFLDETRAPPKASDSDILVLERRWFLALILEDLICTSGGCRVLVVWARVDSVMAILVKVVALSNNDLVFSWQMMKIPRLEDLKPRTFIYILYERLQYLFYLILGIVFIMCFIWKMVSPARQMFVLVLMSVWGFINLKSGSYNLMYKKYSRGETKRDIIQIWKTVSHIFFSI
jgi:hypothetical protein